jgi:hypothetical protein
MPRCYKQDIWSNELVVGQLPASKNVSTETEDFVQICHQATTGEDTSDWEDLVHAVVNCRLCELVIALYLLVVSVQKIQLPIQTRTTVTLQSRDNMFYFHNMSKY